MISKKMTCFVCGFFFLSAALYDAGAGGELPDEEELSAGAAGEMFGDIGVPDMQRRGGPGSLEEGFPPGGKGLNQRAQEKKFGYNPGNDRALDGKGRFPGSSHNFVGIFGRAGGGMRGPLFDKELQMRLEKIFDLRRQTVGLAVQYRETENEKERTCIKEKIKQVLTQLFEETLIEKQEKIKNLRKLIEKEEKTVSKSKSRKEELVQKRLEKITGDREEFDF